MKAFLKALLLVLAVLLLIKLLPLTLALGVGLGFGVVLVAALGVSALAALFCAVLAITAALSPIWLPVLWVVGLIALIKRCSRANA